MMYGNVNVLAIIVAAVANMVIGMLWYSPAVFGKAWMKASGVSMDKMKKANKNMGKTYGMMFLGTLLMTYILANFINLTNATTAVGGAMTGFWLWLGFVATTKLSDVLFEGKSMLLYKINAGYYLVSMALMGALLAVWR